MKFFDYTFGSTRQVFFLGKFVIKIPTFIWYRGFLSGLLANHQEKIFSNAGYDGLCPVLFSLPGGILNIMPRAEPLTNEEWQTFDYESFLDREDYTIPAEEKQDSFGKLNGKIVVVDYGT